MAWCRLKYCLKATRKKNSKLSALWVVMYFHEPILLVSLSLSEAEKHLLKHHTHEYELNLTKLYLTKLRPHMWRKRTYIQYMQSTCSGTNEHKTNTYSLSHTIQVCVHVDQKKKKLDWQWTNAQTINKQISKPAVYRKICPLNFQSLG